MSCIPEVVLISLDPPYRIPEEADSFVFLGWAEVSDAASSDIRLSLNGVDVPITLYDMPEFAEHFAGKSARGFYGNLEFATWAKAAADQVNDPVLLLATVTAEGRSRTFEYAVTDAWLQRLFGRPLKARPVPPEHLQIRVTGAAAGGFHVAGREVADQIASLLNQVGAPLTSHRRILDFGCGPGRVISSIKDMHPRARLFGSDIDPEAIEWAQQNLGDIADFRVNGAEPPLPFEAESFDLIYSISIFTHLPQEMQWGMLSELRRILKPGGILVTTKLDPLAYDLPDAVKLAALESGFSYWGAADETEGLPDFYRLAYHTKAYVEREWGRYFQVLHVGSHDLNNTQDAVVLRRPTHALSWLPAPARRHLHRLKSALTSA